MTIEPTPRPDALGDEQARVAAVVEQLKAGVLQRRSERATAGASDSEARFRLLEAKRHEYVRQPLPVSPRPVLGRFLVLFRKLTYHLLLKWHARGVGDQQNAFNQASLRLLEDLVSGDESRNRELARLAERVDQLERELAALRASQDASPGAPSDEGS